MNKIREKLEELYNSFDFEGIVQRDPIRFPKRYSNPLDIEITGFISSCFSYGSIKCFCNFLENLFRMMGKNPLDFILTFKPSKILDKLKFKYRFSSANDVVGLLYTLKILLINSPSKSLEQYFYSNLHNKNSRYPLLVYGISNFVSLATKIDLSPVYGKNIKTQGFLHFFPDPLKGSPCKRINMFLRWMVRNRDIDFGLWRSLKPSQLIIPLDIHVWRVSQKLGLTTRKNQNLKTAIEITEYLKQIEPEDPLKYDFVLCHGDINSAI